MNPARISRLQLEIVEHVTDLFARLTPDTLTYHNLDHTKAVANYAMEIAASCDLTEVDLFTVFAAAWFHDTGQLLARQRQHEEKSIELVGEFFKDRLEVSPAIIGNIERCILATKLPQQPHTLLEEIICDADTYHLGTPEFADKNELVKEESRRRGMDVSNWDLATYRLLAAHRFHTPCCKERLEEGKQKNLLALKERIQP